MNGPLEIIIEGCWLAVRFGMRVSPVPTGNLRLVDGLYAFGAEKIYHPLEATLVETTSSGDWQQDVANVVGVDAPWIAGFLHGFAQEPESSTNQGYLQGFLAAEELRVTRYQRYLPDRPGK